MAFDRNRANQTSASVDSHQTVNSRTKKASRSQLRGLPYNEGVAALSPMIAQAAPNRESKGLINANQAAAAIRYNIQAHSISILSQTRKFLIKNGWVKGNSADEKERLNQRPTSIVNEDFVQGVAAYQKFKEIKSIDGKMSPETFQLFQKQGLGYSLQGGAHKPGRNVVPKGAPEDQVYDYFRAAILEQGGIFTDRPGHVNVIGIRGGKLTGGDGIEHVSNEFNQWNDTLVVLQVDSNGVKKIDMYEGTTDPGVLKNGVATIPEGTFNMELGYHAPRSGNYPALNPQNQGYQPVFRRNQGFHQGSSSGAGQWLNIHTTHGYNKGALAGPGGYSEGCTVINGQDAYNSFIQDMKKATYSHKQKDIYYTVISAGRLGTLQIKTQEKR